MVEHDGGALGGAGASTRVAASHHVQRGVRGVLGQLQQLYSCKPKLLIKMYEYCMAISYLFPYKLNQFDFFCNIPIRREIVLVAVKMLAIKLHTNPNSRVGSPR